MVTWSSSLRSLGGPLASLSLLLAVGCGDASEAMIGPEGGEIRVDNVTVLIPPGAMGSVRTVKISQTDANLSRSSFEQVGDAYVLEPTDLKLKIPATVTFSKLKDVSEPTVLHQPGDANKVHTYGLGSGEEAIGYIGAFGTISAAKGGSALAAINDPLLSLTPDEANGAAPMADEFHLAFTPNGLSLVDLVLTAYDLNGENNRDLNGGAYCAFKPKPLSVQGASIVTGCTTGSTTVTLSLTGANVDLSMIPFLLGKADSPVVVQVEVGSQDLVNHLGYLAFKTRPCFAETCSGYGTCVENGDVASCMCDDGYAPDPETGLECLCVPKCDGRECGGDSCGGQCGPGCGDGFDCNGDNGQCEPNGNTTDPSTSTSTSTSTSGDPTTTGDPSTSTSTTGMDPTTGTTGDPTTGTTGMDTTGTTGP